MTENKVSNEDTNSMALFAELNPEPVIRFNAEGYILKSNPASDAIFNSRLNDKNVKDILPPIQGVDLQHLISNNRIESFEHQVSERIISFKMRGISELNIVQMYGFDITERVKAQKGYASMALFARLNPEPVIRVNKKGEIIQANEVTCKILKDNEIIGDSLTKWFNAFADIDFAKFIEEEKVETIVQEKNKRTIRFVIKGIKEFSVCQIYGLEISEKLNALKEAHSMALVAELSPDPIFRIDPSGFVLHANPAANKKLGDENIVGWHIGEILIDSGVFNVKEFITENKTNTVTEDIDDRIYSFYLSGIADLNICQVYATDITERVLAQDKLKKQTKNVNDSLLYGTNIQNAVLPSTKAINTVFNDHFMLYKPRDIVSGDFYWLNENENYLTLVVADCTGHGVPGAFMTMLGVALLNEIIFKNPGLSANMILEELRKRVKEKLPVQQEHETNDGMDMTLIIVEKKSLKANIACAYNHFYYFRNNQLNTIKADRMPIGNHFGNEKPFSNHHLQLQKGDTLYMYTDGFSDQFGGKDNVKFSSKKLKLLLGQIQSKTMTEQKNVLDQTITDWQGQQKQVDDILLCGIRV